MSRPSANLRLFAAVYPPVESARTLAGMLAGLALPAHRATPEGQLHMTLQFIGDTPSRALGGVVESVRRSAAGIGPFVLSVRGLVALPEGGPARLVAAVTDAPAALLEVQRRLVHRLSREARARPGDRFLPHITLCRFSPARRIGAPVCAAPPAPFEVREVRLVRSTLSPAGAAHHAVEVVPLEG